MGKAPEPGAPEAGMLGVTSEGSGLLTTASTPQSSLCSSPCAPWGPNSSWSIWVSGWNSPGRAPSRQLRASVRSTSHSCLARVGAAAARTRRLRTASLGWGPRRAHVPRRCSAPSPWTTAARCTCGPHGRPPCCPPGSTTATGRRSPAQRAVPPHRQPRGGRGRV